jgi:hypothetical protein
LVDAAYLLAPDRYLCQISCLVEVEAFSGVVMWSSSERDVFQMELSLSFRSRKRDVKNEALSVPNFQKIANDIVFTDFSKDIRIYQAGTVRLYLKDKKIVDFGGKSFLVMLLAISDKRRPNHVLSDPTSASRREISKEDHEGNDNSCHIVVSLESTLQGGRCYRAAFESVPLFSMLYIQRLIRYLLRRVSIERNYTAANPAGVKEKGEFEQVPVCVVGELKAVPSDELLKDMQKGVLGEIELSREEDGTRGFDENSYTVDKRTTMLLKPVNKNALASVMDIVKSVCTTAEKRHFTIAKVTWKANERSQTARFACDTASPIENRYIKRCTFQLPRPLPASCELIDEHLSRSMMSWAS